MTMQLASYATLPVTLSETTGRILEEIKRAATERVANLLDLAA